MGSADLLQNFVIVALDTQADTVETLAAQPAQQPLVHRIGIGFKGDLRGGGNIKVFTDGCEDGRHTVRTKVAGRTAAEVDGIYQIIRSLSTGFPDVLTNGFAVVFQQLALFGGNRVKVTVLTLTPAEGHMDINAQRFLVFTGKKGHVCLLVRMTLSL